MPGGVARTSNRQKECRGDTRDEGKDKVRHTREAAKVTGSLLIPVHHSIRLIHMLSEDGLWLVPLERG
jgi:hypothetical protein